ALFLRGSPAEAGILAIPPGHLRRGRASSAFAYDLVNACQTGMAIRMTVDAEDARQQDAAAHLEPPQLHVADRFAHDCGTADSGLWPPGIALRHACTPVPFWTRNVISEL